MKPFKILLTEEDIEKIRKRYITKKDEDFIIFYSMCLVSKMLRILHKRINEIKRTILKED